MTRRTPLALLLGAFLLAMPAWGQEVDREAMLRHVRALSVDVGVRRGGSAAERRAAEYAADVLHDSGYEVRMQGVPLPGGGRSVNVIADLVGTSGRTWIVGAHLDSKPPSPGANDNASGVAAVLELARVLRLSPPRDSIRFVLFGAEEILGRTFEDHHYGSRFYAQTMPAAERKTLRGVIVIDAVGAGPDFVIGSMRKVSPLSKALRRVAVAQGYKVQARTDPGWSDHEPFEKRGIPATYVRWRVDPALHTREDAFARVQGWKIKQAADIVASFLRQH